MNKMKYSDEAAFSSPNSTDSWGSYGLTKREYFAGLAMQSLIISVMQDPKAQDNRLHKIVRVIIPKEAIDYADALLEELEKTK